MDFLKVLPTKRNKAKTQFFTGRRSAEHQQWNQIQAAAVVRQRSAPGTGYLC